MGWYSPVLFGLNLFCTIVFILIPILSVLIVFFTKRKFLWAAPIISTVLIVVFSIIALGPSLLTVREYRSMFFGISVPIQLGIVIVLTIIAYVMAYIFGRKQSRK